MIPSGTIAGQKVLDLADIVGPVTVMNAHLMVFIIKINLLNDFIIIATAKQGKEGLGGMEYGWEQKSLKQLRTQNQLFINQQLVMGKKIENYCLETVIGQGQFGKVYKAINQKTEQTVAIKVIKIQKYKISPRLEQFTINEIQTLSKIEDTTHIVKFIEILKTANNVYFVYEYCNGGTLESLIKQNRYLTEDRALAYFKDLLKAFKMLIKNNIMHRDIKPSNILIHNGILKLADFGFCKPLKDARDLSQTMLGSPIYMAPQILKGELYTINADIWSLGVVLFQMLFGFCPFEERNIARLIDLINSSSSIVFPTNIKISKKTQDLLRKMLVKDHFKRISWEELFEYDLNPAPVQNEEPLRSRSPFMKKQFNSVTPLSTNTSQENTILLTNNYSTKNYQETSRPMFKKAQSASAPDSKILKPIIQKRNLIRKGVLMVQDMLKRNNSKLTVYICCFIMKKIKSNIQQLQKQIKSTLADKQNYITNTDIKKALSLVSEQKDKILPKIQPYQQELKLIKLPQDIVYMRYAEEEGLTQEKDGLIQLLEIDNYLLDSSSVVYAKLSKKELLDQYERRIVRKQ